MDILIISLVVLAIAMIIALAKSLPKVLGELSQALSSLLESIFRSLPNVLADFWPLLVCWGLLTPYFLFAVGDADTAVGATLAGIVFQIAYAIIRSVFRRDE